MSELVSQALDLVLYGMGTVFVFLTVLVGATMLMSLALRSDSDGQEGHDEPSQLQKEGAVDPKLLVAISAAVRRHRHSKQ